MILKQILFSIPEFRVTLQNREDDFPPFWRGYQCLLMSTLLVFVGGSLMNMADGAWIIDFA